LELDASLCSYIVDRTFIQADDDEELELLVLCADGGEISVGDPVDLEPVSEGQFVLYDVDWTNNWLTQKGQPQPAPLGGSFAVGDFNGDGVQDFTLAPAFAQAQLWLGSKRGDEGK
jgi:hypothetical protein